MLIETAQFDSGWSSVQLGLSASEIDRLIAHLAALREDGTQHFHLATDFSGPPGVGDIEIYRLDAGTSNASISGLAIDPTR